MKVEADETAERKVEVVNAVVGAWNLAIESEEQRDGVLGDRVG